MIKPQRGMDSIAPYVPGKPIQEVERELGITDIIKLASNENPFGPSPKAVEGVLEALNSVNFYPDGQSYELRQALARHLSVPPDWIIVGNGADGVILETCMAYLDEESEVITSEHSFPMYDIFSQAMRAKVVKVPTKNYGLDLKAMRQTISPKTSLVFVCNPNNPTGTLLRKEEVQEFMEDFPEEVMVVFDEAYYEFAQSEDFPDTIGYLREGRENVLVLRTFSKAYGIAGLRLGYGIGHPQVIATLNKIKEPFAVNLLAQAAGIKALEDQEFVRRTVEAINREKEFLYREFERLELSYVRSYTNFVLVEVKGDAKLVMERLLSRGVIVRPCGGYKLPGHLRITVGMREQNQRLIRALEEVLRETQ
ncbi:MAG: histidinol-phosphate transaminase [Caldiserica bacterium]|nr:histidinol-phosphate transaminase [Caldisericota bacterium]MDH7562280.1 histidinol-phosphate transaminase [Caldisericota bacterium]